MSHQRQKRLEGIQHMIVVGTYTSQLIGLQLDQQQNGVHTINTKFAYKAHDQSVRSLASNNHGVLASGSSDEGIRLYDLRVQREMIDLPSTNASVDALSFHLPDSCLLSGGSDGVLRVWNADTFELLRTKKIVNHPITEIKSHPKVGIYAALSGADEVVISSLEYRNITRIRLYESRGLALDWKPSGTGLAVSASRNVAGANSTRVGYISPEVPLHQVRIIDAQKVGGDDHDQGVTSSITFDQRIVSIKFLGDDCVLTGGDAKQVTLWDIRSSSKPQVIATHKNRVRFVNILYDRGDYTQTADTEALQAGGKSLVTSLDTGSNLVFTDLRKANEPILNYSVGDNIRPTCMDIVYLDGKGKKPSKPSQIASQRTTDKKESKMQKKRRAENERQDADTHDRRHEETPQAERPRKSVRDFTPRKTL